MAIEELVGRSVNGDRVWYTVVEMDGVLFDVDVILVGEVVG